MSKKLAANSTLSHYRIVSKIGAGGMGDVYLAQDTKLDRRVAIKVLPPELVAHKDRLKRFQQEVRAVSSLNHPNILTIHDFGVEKGSHFFAMEFVDGMTLREKIVGGQNSINEILDIAAQASSALSAAHEAGIIHRDIKPDNIMVRKDGIVKVLDFGIAKLTDENASLHKTDPEAKTRAQLKTNPGSLMGTVDYMSPEQTRGADVDSRTDIFSLGVVLYEMLGGHKPFRGDSPIEVMSAILKEDPPEIREANAKISPSLQKIVLKCLEKKPEQRFHSAHDLGFALETVSTGSNSRMETGLDFSAYFTSERTKIFTRKRLGWLLVFALAAITAASLFYAWRLSSSNREQRAFRQLNFRREAVFQASFAPDGKTVVYSAATDGNTPEIFTVHPDYPAPQSVGTPGMHLLDVSSKGDLAVLMDAKYLRHRTFIGKLARLPLVGGAPREFSKA